MSNKQETPQENNFPTKDEDELAMLQWQIKDGEKKAEFIVMSGTLPHVLERILSFLPVRNLKQCRLVNTDWNKAAVLQLRKNLPYLHFPTLDNHSFRDLMMDNKISPFVKFSICPDRMSFHHVERLFNTIAPSATHLSISNNFSKEDRLDHVDMYKIPEFPMLTNLTQTVTSIATLVDLFNNQEQFLSKTEKIDRMLRSTVFGILGKSPKLQNLEVDFSYWGQPSTYLNDLFFESLEKKNNANLNDLHIHGVFENDFSRLIALGLRLRSLSLDSTFAFAHDVRLRNQRSFIDFLSCQSETLVHLELHRLTDFFDRFQFPLLRKIKTLTITGWSPSSRDFQSSPSINYEKLPSLKRLEIKNSQNYWMQFLPDYSYKPVQSVEDLTLDLPNLINEQAEIYVLHIAKCFPNLKVLGEIPVNLQIANSIYKWLPKLEELTFIVGFTQSIDDIITGLSLKKCAAIRLLSLSETRKLSVDNNKQDLDEDSPRPLSSLKNLKILRLKVKESGRNYQPVEFSRVPTLLVLTKMPCLEIIDFGRRSMADIVEIEDDIRDLEDSGKSVLYSF